MLFRAYSCSFELFFVKGVFLVDGRHPYGSDLTGRNVQNAKYFRLLETRAGKRIKGLEFFFAAAEDTLIFATLVIKIK